jgi:hypothetical protein
MFTFRIAACRDEFLSFLDDPICADVLLSDLPGLLALFFCSSGVFLVKKNS